MTRTVLALLVAVLCSCSLIRGNVDELRNRSSNLLIKGDYFSAKKGYTELLELDNRSSARYLYNIAYCLWKLEKYDEAMARLDELIALHPDDDHANQALTLRLYVKAEKENRRRYFISELTDYVEQAPDGKATDLALYLIGLLQMGSRDWSMARQSFERLRTRYQSSKYLTDAEYLIGFSFFEEKNYDEAVKRFEEFISKYPNSDQAWDAKTYLEQIKREGWTPKD